MTEATNLTWLGSILLGSCGVPLAWTAWRDPESLRASSWFFMAMWWAGEVAMLAGLSHAVSWHVLANYIANLLLISYVMGRKFVLPRQGGAH